MSCRRTLPIISIHLPHVLLNPEVQAANVIFQLQDVYAVIWMPNRAFQVCRRPMHSTRPIYVYGKVHGTLWTVDSPRGQYRQMIPALRQSRRCFEHDVTMPSPKWKEYYWKEYMIISICIHVFSLKMPAVILDTIDWLSDKLVIL